MHAVSRKAASQIDSEDGSDAEIAETPPKKTRRTPRRSRKQVAAETCVEGSVNQEENVATKEAGEEESTVSATSVEEPKKTARRGRKKGSTTFFLSFFIFVNNLQGCQIFCFCSCISAKHRGKR